MRWTNNDINTDTSLINNFLIYEQDTHRKIVEKDYDKTKDDFKINLLKEYGLRYFSDYLFASVDYGDDAEEIEWHTKLLQLAKNEEFEKKQ